MTSEWGPLAALIGEWEGEGGLDSAFSHSRNEVVSTPYLEKLTMKPFGPVDNGSQALYGLDYKSAMWRGDEENPFHTEVGYWLTANADDTWSYAELTTLLMAEFDAPFPHSDANTLRRTA